MSNYNIEPSNLLLDFESFSETGIELSATQIDRTIELSDRIINPERQWQTYLNSLALFGFQTWLAERDSSLILNCHNCSVKQPQYANYIDGVFNLIIGEYKICLLTNGVAIDEVISIDRSLIELPEYVAHFYVLVNVIEEQAEVSIDCFISYDELMQHQQTANLTPDIDWTYEIPVAWFNSQPDDLLLCLRCLDAPAITLPVKVSSTPELLSQLEPLLPQLQSPTAALPQILTWQQAASILSNPDLLNWLYELQTTQPAIKDSLVNLRNALSTAITEINQTAINVKTWLNNQLDEFAQNLSWMLLPPVEFAPSGFRDLAMIDRESAIEEFKAIMIQLRASGEDIPQEARGAYQDFNLGSHALRLFAVTWMISTTDNSEWSLLLVLGAQPNTNLPQGLKLELIESETVLDTKLVTENMEDTYLYTQVIGELEEQFTVKIVLADGTTFTFPNFAFN